MQDWMQQAAADAAATAPTEAPPPPPVVPGLELHVDGDLLCYWAGGSEDTSVAESRQRAVGRVNTMAELIGAERVIIHLTEDGSTKGDRRIIATVKPYQAQRKASRKPKNWQYLRDWLAQQTLWRVKSWGSREADDGISLCAYDACFKGKLIGIASGDKDMRMLPGIHVDWQDFSVVTVPHGTYELVAENGKVYGTKWFLLQMLQGDTADNIPGLPRYQGKPVGPVTAANLLSGTKTLAEGWEIVAGCYAHEYGEDYRDRVVEQAMLLWLRTDAAAWCGDFWRYTGPANQGWLKHINKVQDRIKEAYAEAYRITSHDPET